MSKNGSLFPCNTKVPLAWLPTYIYCRRKIKKDLHPDECMFPVLYTLVHIGDNKENVFFYFKGNVSRLSLLHIFGF